MYDSNSRPRPDTWVLLFVAVALAMFSFLLQSRSGISLADEGFLWYGAVHTAQGEVPLRDFQSYDPGRYDWCAAGVILFGKGLVALRFSETLFQIIGLWLGLLAASRLTTSRTVLFAIGLMLLVWMFPSHKLFDHTLLLAGIWAALRLIENPSRARLFAAGCFVGLCAFFGRNHALYNFAGQVGLLLLLWVKAPAQLPLQRVALWVLGMAVGSLPLAAMLLFVPGFFAAYQESVLSILHHGANLPRPIPWPWRWSFSGAPLEIASQTLLGTLFIAVPFAYAIALSWSLFARLEVLRRHPLFVACAFVGTPYFYHAFSRADFSHLAQSIHPFTLGLLAALALLHAGKNYFYPAIIGLVGLGLIGFGGQLAVYRRLTSKVPWVAYDAGGTVFIMPRQRQFFDCLKAFVTRNLGPEQTLLIAPFTPGLYPLLDRPSPLRELYFLFPASPPQQDRMIDILADKKVDWALVSDVTLDGREDLRFSVTHDLLWRYLIENFDPVPVPCLPRSMKMLHRKGK